MFQGTSGNAIQTAVTKVSYKDLEADTSSDDRTIPILTNAKNETRLYYITRVFGAVSTAWAGTTVTCKVGDDSDDDGYIASSLMLSSYGVEGSGTYFDKRTVTTAGANTGTSGAGLSLIPATVTGGVVDDDNAATTGAAVNVVPESNGVTAYLESTTAGNADTTFEVGNGGPTVLINDNDTPGGVQLYFDEDAASADSRFLAVSPTGADIFVPSVGGGVIRVAHDASAATNGVAVYADDDAANAYEKLMFVSPTDTAGTYTLDDTVGMQTSGGILMNDLLALQEDVDSLNTSLKEGYRVSYTSTDGVKAVLTPGAAWSSLTAGEAVFVVEYLNLTDLTN